jgi:glycosyltransferase involved in cell wall biosynthesis
MIVKDEQKYLPDCLESVKDVADEIVIVDTGSSDNTIKIAEQFGAKVFNFKWIDDFAAARNFSLKHSTGDWILYLDADERLTESSIEEVKQIINSTENLAVQCLVDCIDNHNNKASVIKYARLFKNHPELKFSGRVHEQIVESLKGLNFKTQNSNIKILHLGYDIPKAELEKKAVRNLTLLLKEFITKPTIYGAFQIAQSYGVLDDSKNVIKYFDYILNTPASPKLYKAHAYRYKAAKAFEKGEYKKALSIVGKGIKLDPDQPLLNMLVSKIHLLTGNLSESLSFINKAYIGNSSDTEKDFELKVDSRAVLYLALRISSAAKSVKDFNFYFNELEKINSEELNNNSLLNFVRSLFNGEPIPENQLDEYSSTINNSNCDLIFSLIEKYPDINTKLKLLKHSSHKLSEHTAFLNTYGLALLEKNEPVDAADAFERSIAKKVTEPAVLFYLISAYVQLEKYEKIIDVIELAEKHFFELKEVMERVKLMKDKLAAFA